MAYLLSHLIRKRDIKNSQLNYLWIANEILNVNPGINDGFKSIVDESKNQAPFEFYEFITKAPTIQNLAVSLQSKNDAEWKNLSALSIARAKVT